MWENEVFEGNTRSQLIHTIWYYFTKCLGFRGFQAARQLM